MIISEINNHDSNTCVKEGKKTLDEKVLEMELNNHSQDIVIRLMMQSFLNDMYSSIDECPFSVVDKQEW